MSPLEISTAAMSANSGSLIIVCAVASAVILVISFFRERLKAFNARHKVITYSDTIVRPVSWNGGKDGIDIDGIPYYGSYENEDEDTPVDNVMSIPTAIKTKEAKEVKEVKEYGDSGSHAA